MPARRIKRTFPVVFSFLLALLLSYSLLPAQISFAADSATSTSTAAGASAAEEAAPDLKDDFYEAINYEQLNEWEIPSVWPSIDNFYILDNMNQRRLNDILKDAQANSSAEPGSDEYNVGALLATALDKEARNAGGYGKVQDFIDEVDAAQSLSELIEAVLVFDRIYGGVSFFDISVGIDFLDSNRYVYQLMGADTGLSQEEWFSEEKEMVQRIGCYQEFIAELWELNGASTEEATAIAQEVTGVMKELASASLTVAEKDDATKAYNPYMLSDLEILWDGLLPMDRVYELYGGGPDDIVVVSDPGLLEATVAFLQDADLELVKRYVKTCLFLDLADYVSMDSYDASSKDYACRLGLEEIGSFESEAFGKVSEQLPFECDRLYADRYFSKDIVADIQTVIDDIVVVYEQRIQSLSWLDDETKAEALKKLDTLEAYIGIPETWPQDAYDLKLLRPEEGGLYIDNVFTITEAMRNRDFGLMGKPVDKTMWMDAPQVANAFYYPYNNSITLLAGILQEPLYDADASPEYNLGMLGTIIAHEITHAFDSLGSQYDEQGNLRDWWTQEDAEEFETLAQQVVDYFDGLEVDGIAIDGEMTLAENIADLGAVACVTEVAKNRGYDLQAVYSAYAQLWAEKVRPEYMAELAAVDTHSFGKIRTNAVLSATDGFYEAFDIQEGDGMYVAPEDRPHIW